MSGESAGLNDDLRYSELVSKFVSKWDDIESGLVRIAYGQGGNVHDTWSFSSLLSELSKLNILSPRDSSDLKKLNDLRDLISSGGPGMDRRLTNRNLVLLDLLSERFRAGAFSLVGVPHSLFTVDALSGSFYSSTSQLTTNWSAVLKLQILPTGLGHSIIPVGRTDFKVIVDSILPFDTPAAWNLAQTLVHSDFAEIHKNYITITGPAIIELSKSGITPLWTPVYSNPVMRPVINQAVILDASFSVFGSDRPWHVRHSIPQGRVVRQELIGGKVEAEWAFSQT